MSCNWPKVRLGDVCKIRRGSSPRPIVQFMAESGMPWVKIADATETHSRFIEKTNEFIKHEGVPKSVIVNEGDLILSNSGTAGLPKFMKITACIHDGWQTLSDFDGIDKFFLYYSLLNIRSNLLRNAHDSTMKNLTLDMVRDAEIHLPTLSEQKSIATVLSDIDSKFELNVAINQNLEQIAQAIFKSWFVDFDPVKAKMNGEQPEGMDEETASLFPEKLVESELGLIPDGWELTNIGKVSECFDKKRIPLSKRQREQKQGSIPYYGATSVMDYVDEAIFDDIYLLIGEDGSVMKDDGTPFIQYIWGPAWVNNHAHVLQGIKSVSTEQLMLFFQQTNINAYVTGAVQLKINQRNMNSIPFIKAPKEINERFYDVVAPLYAKIRAIKEENEQLAKLRDTLLPKLLSGEIELETAKEQ
ncbi:restriction endonuclease subunit S [Vibrio parahaemolyticus]|uniref:restriction endonuclease subunit S n=1 Tax=Vibrio parahaemolyticus TaxID=670 RepID=UPI0009B0E8D3|nr:restriction endonuclease subunit S [Vibrio parahaemolyticus]